MTKQATFFSYSRTDAAFVLKLAKDLRAAGSAVWLDQLDIKPGSDWDSSIEKALNDSANLIIVLSPTSVASNNVMDEVSYALENGKTVIPVLLQECAVPFRLRRLQRIDFTGDYDAGLQHLLQVLAKPGNEENTSIAGTGNRALDEQISSQSDKRDLPAAQNTVSEKSNTNILKYALAALAVIAVILVVIWATGAFKTGNSTDTAGQTTANTDTSSTGNNNNPIDSATEAKQQATKDSTGNTPIDSKREKDIPSHIGLGELVASMPSNPRLIPDWNRESNQPYLNPNEAIASNNKKYFVLYQPDGDLVIYNRTDKDAIIPIWSSNTKDNKSKKAIMQSNGDLAIYNGEAPGQKVYISQTYNHQNAVIKLEDNGNLVIYETPGNKPLWESFTSRLYPYNPTPTITEIPPKKIDPSMIKNNVNVTETKKKTAVKINPALLKP